jgi:predicted regulator of Ras-like GTPase activity (Roadblock/LC7/MglB family)
MLLKLIDTTVSKLNLGVVENELLTTERAYLMVRFLESKSYFLGIAVNRRAAKLGNIRLITKIYVKRISEAIPH